MHRHRSRGQAMIEFALILPLMLFMCLGVLDVGRVVWAMDITANAAREAARFAIVHGGSSGTACPVGPSSGQSSVPHASASCPHPSPSTQAIKDLAVARSVAAGSNLSVTVCYGADCQGDTHTPGSTNARGTLMTVRIVSNLPLIVPQLLGIAGFTVNSSSTMVVSN
jgi:Flp pilus assembly protein TadG